MTPGELLDEGFAPPLQEKKWTHEEEEASIQSPDEVESPPSEPPPTLRTVTVR